MDSWSRIQQLPPDYLNQINLIYGTHFPIEVRYVLSEWLQEKPWKSYDVTNPQFRSYAVDLYKSLMEELHIKMKNEKNFVMHMKMQEAALFFMKVYGGEPEKLIGIIKSCFEEEAKIIQQAESSRQVTPNLVQNNVDPLLLEIERDIEILKRRTTEIEHELRSMARLQEDFVLQFQEYQKFKTLYQQISSTPNGQVNAEMLNKMRMEDQESEEKIRQRANELLQMRNTYVEKQRATAAQMKELQSRVLEDELQKWKRYQQYPENGVTVQTLDKIQEWCEAIAALLWQSRQHIKAASVRAVQVPLSSTNTTLNELNALENEITNLLSSLISRSLVVEQQPPQVLKIGNKFSTAARLLIGDKLTAHMILPDVEVAIINEAQAAFLFENERGNRSDASGELLNNYKPMEYNATSKLLGVSFRNMQVKKVRRTNTRGQESVTDEKFALLFRTKIPLGDGEYSFPVWTITLPLTVTVHCSQEQHAWAPVTWDNAFAEPGRKPFVVPDKVLWPRVAEVLNMKFCEVTSKGLSSSHLQYLAGKAFKCPQTQDFSNSYLSWSQFCKEPISPKNFTFWDWFYSIMKVTKDHLKEAWSDNLISMGFVSRQQAEEALLQERDGTFLLRFSDSELGGVTIAWVSENQMHRKNVYMVQPFTHKDFAIRSLSDRVRDLDQLLYLYPNIPKDKAFGKYYTNTSDSQPMTSNGYVKSEVVIQTKKIPDEPSMYSSPSTPHSPALSEYQDCSSVPSPGPTHSLSGMPGSVNMYNNPATPQSLYSPQPSDTRDFQETTVSSPMSGIFGTSNMYNGPATPQSVYSPQSSNTQDYQDSTVASPMSSIASPHAPYNTGSAQAGIPMYYQDSAMEGY